MHWVYYIGLGDPFDDDRRVVRTADARLEADAAGIADSDRVGQAVTDRPPDLPSEAANRRPEV
jgi:hypothetical protein